MEWGSGSQLLPVEAEKKDLHPQIFFFSPKNKKGVSVVEESKVYSELSLAETGFI